MAAYFKTSTYGELNRSSINSYYDLYVNKPELKRTYDASATSERSRYALNSESYTLSIPMQIRLVMRRRWQILRGDWATLTVQLGSVLRLANSACSVETDMTTDVRFSRLFTSGLCSGNFPATRVHTLCGVVFSTCMYML